MSGSPQRSSGRIRTLGSLGADLAILGSVVCWGGTTLGGPLFLLGVAVMMGIALAFDGVIWWFSLVTASLPNV